MKDQTKTKAQLIEELTIMRRNMAETEQRVIELETSAIAAWQAGERLPPSEERFRQFILSFGDHIYVTEVTETGRRVNLYLSPNVEKLTGYSEAQLMSNWSFWPSRIVHPDDRAAAAVQSAQLARGQHSEVEYRLASITRRDWRNFAHRSH
ncbi:MAG: PAS domain-containing protein [Chloroflexi bacterium]|nr:PAS domain-containing protein [Chloroflexota bacterium]